MEEKKKHFSYTCITEKYNILHQWISITMQFSEKRKMSIWRLLYHRICEREKIIYIKLANEYQFCIHDWIYSMYYNLHWYSLEFRWLNLPFDYILIKLDIWVFIFILVWTMNISLEEAQQQHLQWAEFNHKVTDIDIWSNKATCEYCRVSCILKIVVYFNLRYFSHECVYYGNANMHSLHLCYKNW